MAHSEEPSLKQGNKPELLFQNALITEIKSILSLRKESGTLSNFFIIPRFGLDIAVFLKNGNRSSVRFIEIKVYKGDRPGGVGFGNQKGEGIQVDLVSLDQEALMLADQFIRWVVYDSTRQGEERFALVTNSTIKASAMGEVKQGKQNNIRIKDLKDSMVTWAQLMLELEGFLGDPPIQNTDPVFHSK